MLTMPSLACCLRYALSLLPSTLKEGVFTQEACGQRLQLMLTMSRSACCLQNFAVFVPRTPKLARVEQVEFEHRPIQVLNCGPGNGRGCACDLNTITLTELLT